MGIVFKTLKDKSEIDSPVLNQAVNIAGKAANDISFYHSVIEPIDSMGFAGVDYLTGLAQTTLNVLTDGDREMQKILFKGSSAIRDW